jgi:hypothetical protein
MLGDSQDRKLVKSEQLLGESVKGIIPVIVSAGFVPRSRLLKVSDLGVTRCAGHPYAVHKLPRSLHHK